jgi:hypothetical protein
MSIYSSGSANVRFVLLVALDQTRVACASGKQPSSPVQLDIVLGDLLLHIRSLHRRDKDRDRLEEKNQLNQVLDAPGHAP